MKLALNSCKCGSCVAIELLQCVLMHFFVQDLNPSGGIISCKFLHNVCQSIWNDFLDGTHVAVFEMEIAILPLL